MFGDVPLDEVILGPSPSRLDLRVHLLVIKLQKEVLLLDPVLILGEEVQFLEVLLEGQEMLVVGVVDDELLVEAADVEAGLVEDEVHEGQGLQHELLGLGHALEAEVYELALPQQLPEGQFGAGVFVVLGQHAQ